MSDWSGKPPMSRSWNAGFPKRSVNRFGASPVSVLRPTSISSNAGSVNSSSTSSSFVGIPDERVQELDTAQAANRHPVLVSRGQPALRRTPARLTRTARQGPGVARPGPRSRRADRLAGFFELDHLATRPRKIREVRALCAGHSCSWAEQHRPGAPRQVAQGGGIASRLHDKGRWFFESRPCLRRNDQRESRSIRGRLSRHGLGSGTGLGPTAHGHTDSPHRRALTSSGEACPRDSRSHQRHA